MEGPTRGTLGAGAKLIAALYIVAVAALPFGHHDLLCHLRSSTHCDVCHVATSADTGGHHALPLVHLQDVGCAVPTSTRAASSATVIRSSGRSPPSASRKR